MAIITPIIQAKTNSNNANKSHKANLQKELEEENALNRAHLEKQLSDIIAKIERLRLEKERQRLEKEIESEKVRKEHDRAMLLLNMEKEKRTIELELKQVRSMEQVGVYNAQLTELDKKIQLEKSKAQLLQETTHRLQSEIEALQTKIIRDKHIHKKPIYLKNPLIKRNNTLVLSDRCIELNGKITPWRANYIVDQIDYFNNKNSEWPIFLIIGDSPGGFISAGWNIIQAIWYSKAPVYVVVKRFAASMAALITTLATKSYAYPNAKILHHHPTCCGLLDVNLRETKEIYDRLKEAWKRLGGKVSQKMGISLSAFEKMLYEKSMYGHWTEYGDKAKKLKWVDYVINGIHNSAVSDLPDSSDYTCKNYIQQYYGFDITQEAESSAEERYYHTLVPNDFDYSYKPDRKIQMINKP